MAETPAGETPPPPSPAISSNGPTSDAQVTAPSAAAFPVFRPVMTYPAPSLPPAMVPLQSLEEQDQGPGIYAIPYNPYMCMAPFPMFPPTNTLVPLTYKIPTAENSAAVIGLAQGQDARQQPGAQRQVVVRRFHFAFQLDLALIIKLAAVVFLFSQDGSKQRLVLLCFLALLVYLYQTGALAPLIRWVNRPGAVRPPQRPLHADNRPPVPQNNNGNDQRQAGNIPNANVNQNQAAAENQEAPPPAANENRPEQDGGGNRGNNWLGILKEIQVFVVGFVASLLPGFQHNE